MSGLDFAYLVARAVEDRGAWDAGLYRELSLPLLEADLRRLREKAALPDEEYQADPNAQ